MIERRPRAPVRRSRARLAMAWRACSRNSSSTPSIARSFWYCLTSAFFGSVRIFTERAGIELVEHRHHRAGAHEFGDEAVLDEVLGLDVVQERVQLLAVVHRAHVRAEAHAGAVGAVLDHLLQAAEGAAADEEDVGRVDLHEFLVRVLAAALRAAPRRSCPRSASGAPAARPRPRRRA